MSSYLRAVGTANPAHRIAQDDILQFMIASHKLDIAESRKLKALYAHSGIEHRYSVLPDFTPGEPVSPAFFAHDTTAGFPGTASRQERYRACAADIGAAAVQDCLSGSGLDATGVTHLITVSCTGMYAPGLDIDLLEKLNLPRSTERTCINFMGCYGVINALKSADYICRADPSAKVLIVSVELCTLHFQSENTPENWVANSLFSDGAAAALVEPFSPGKTGLALDAFYAEYIHEARDEMGWYIGDTGFNMRLSAKVPAQIGLHIAGLAGKLGAKTARPGEGTMRYAIHPGGKKILEAAENALGFSAEMNREAYAVLRDYGNMSSATILFVLKKMLENGLRDQEEIMAFAFGPGLTVESMLLKNHGENS